MFVITVWESQEVEEVVECWLCQGLEVDIAISEGAQPIAEFVTVVLLASLLGEAFLSLAKSSTSPGGLPQVALADEPA
jgi:hypothetical protein